MNSLLLNMNSVKRNQIKIIDESIIESGSRNRFQLNYKPKFCKCGHPIDYFKAEIEVGNCIECGKSFSNVNLITGGLITGILILAGYGLYKLCE